MPIPISYPLINGHRYSWSSVEIGLPGGGIVRGVKSIDYGDKLTPGTARGTGPTKLGRSRGEYDADGSLEMYRLEAENLKEGLGGDGYGEVSFVIPVMYADRNQPTIKDELMGVRITEQRAGGSEGSDLLTVKFTLDIMFIDWNGKRLFTPTSGG